LWGGLRKLVDEALPSSASSPAHGITRLVHAISLTPPHFDAVVVLGPRNLLKCRPKQSPPQDLTFLTGGNPGVEDVRLE
jgi:hypothetical protein